MLWYIIVIEIPFHNIVVLSLTLNFHVARQKRWDEALERPPLNYTEFFDPDVGQIPGLTVWEIENFLPNQIEDAAQGKFYEGDCYIVLQTTVDESHNLQWQIYFWIGEKSTVSSIIFVRMFNTLNFFKINPHVLAILIA